MDAGRMTQATWKGSSLNTSSFNADWFVRTRNYLGRHIIKVAEERRI